jgi:methionyl-tRNA formyltransferase
MHKISIICSSQQHPIYPLLQQWLRKNKQAYAVELVASANELRESGDFLFLISCGELIPAKVRNRFTHTLVLHASDLPEGRGWSPHIWQLIASANYITLSLLEAEDAVDTGRIWAKKRIDIAPHELFDEINAKLFAAEIELMDSAIKHHGAIFPRPQTSPQAQIASQLQTAPQAQIAHQVQAAKKTAQTNKPNHYRLRTPQDSQLDVNASLASQFNLLRVCDPERFPAFFEHNGAKYTVKIEKVGLTEDE